MRQNSDSKSREPPRARAELDSTGPGAWLGLRTTDAVGVYAAAVLRSDRCTGYALAAWVDLAAVLDRGRDAVPIGIDLAAVLAPEAGDKAPDPCEHVGVAVDRPGLGGGGGQEEGGEDDGGDCAER
jgi:hypothetical protein